ncbi:MAG TPA: hypothetical protein VL595_25830 [Pseudonocardia sp.]|nr:hypothetical protein [Pseudonocardia sp.]
MDSAGLAAAPVQRVELLQAIVNLAEFHREHEKFYASSPREEAVVLQRHARVLQALADAWLRGRAGVAATDVRFAGAPDLNDRAALQLEGVLFMEGEGEPVELTRLKRDIEVAGQDSVASGEWLAGAMDSSWRVAEQLLEVVAVADLLGERHRIIANDWQAAGLSTLAGRLLLRAAGILDQVDFTPAALRADLAGFGFAPNYLYSAAELIGRAADLLSESAGLVHDNERRWRVFRARAVELVGPIPDPCGSTAASPEAGAHDPA